MSTSTVHYSSATAEWLTPKTIIGLVLSTFQGPIDLDPCSEVPAPGQPYNVPALRRFTAADDGLVHPWLAGTVWMNPPYGRAIGEWVWNLVDEYFHTHFASAIALLPARTDTKWWQFIRDYPVCFVRGRLHFVGGSGPAPFPSAIVYLGPSVERFAQVFGEIGDVWERRK